MVIKPKIITILLEATINLVDLAVALHSTTTHLLPKTPVWVAVISQAKVKIISNNKTPGKTPSMAWLTSENYEYITQKT